MNDCEPSREPTELDDVVSALDDINSSIDSVYLCLHKQHHEEILKSIAQASWFISFILFWTMFVPFMLKIIHWVWNSFF